MARREEDSDSSMKQGNFGVVAGVACLISPGLVSN